MDGEIIENDAKTIVCTENILSVFAKTKGEGEGEGENSFFKFIWISVDRALFSPCLLLSKQ